MLRISLCTDRRENTARMMEAVCRRDAMQRLLIVPEQFSHIYEKKLCEAGGKTISRYAEVLSFSRLATRVFSIYGGAADTQTDAGGKLLQMSLAVEQVRSRLKIYGNSAAKPDFLLALSDMLDEFRAFCVSPSLLRKAAQSLSGVLAVKAEEFALLTESVDAVAANLGQNPETRLTRLLHALEENDFATGKRFYFDAFTDFNGVEREILAALLNQGAEVTVCLQCDRLHHGGQQFSAARETARILLALAARQSVQTEVVILPPGKGLDALHYLRSHLFGGAVQPYPKEQSAVCFLSASDSAAQCRAVAGELLRLAAEGVRWREMAIACTEYEACSPMLRSVLHRAGIPAYFAGNSSLLREPVIQMLFSALEAATEGMERESVIAYLKSGFLDLPREHCDRLENYALLWDISGSRWETEWTMNPNGYRSNPDEKSAALLETLNADRVRAIAPLAHLRDGLRAAKNVAQMALACNAFLEEIQMNERLNDLARRFFDAGEMQRAQEYAQVYAIFCGLLEQVYGVLGECVRTPEDFFRLLRTAAGRYTVGTIPASLDCVSVGSLLSQRRAECGYLFLLGAEEGAFPAAQSSKSLLTDEERSSLLRFGIGVEPTAEGRLERELAAIDSVLCSPGERLCLCATAGREAYLLRRAQKLFPSAAVCGGTDELISRSRRDYIAYLTAEENRASLAPPSALSEAARALRREADYSLGALSQEAVHALYGKTLRLSSSKIDVLASCRFCFFLQYGLKAQERETAEIDPSLYGTFVHDVLEHTARQVMQEGGFHIVPLERVVALAEARMEYYATHVLADLWESARAEYLFRRTFAEVRSVVKELYSELSVSQFTPQWFELHFADRNGDLPAVHIAGKEANICLEGFVDRADVWQRGETVYVRVVDYKTGKKHFDFSKIFIGVGLQMLLYLFALERTGEKPLTPAGVLYFPARVERVLLPDRLDAQTLEKKRDSSRKRSGLLLDDEGVLQAMEPCADDPQFMPYSYNKEGARTGNIASTAQLRLLEKHVFSTVAALADTLYAGELTPNPYYFDAMNNACQWCPYGGICGGGEKRWPEKLYKADALWERLEGCENG